MRSLKKYLYIFLEDRLIEDINWNAGSNKENGPDKDFEVSFIQYDMNLWFVEKTIHALQDVHVPFITIHIERGAVPPIGTIAWVNSKIGKKSSIPVAMNQYHDVLKKEFIKAGGRIFREINYKSDVKLSSEPEHLNKNLFHEMRGKI